MSNSPNSVLLQLANPGANGAASPVAIGKPAPIVALQAYDRTQEGKDGQFRTISLEDYKGHWVFLFFYPRNFTAVCPTEIVSFNTHLAEFEDRDCVVLTASTDSEFAHKGWCDSHADLGKLRYPMLADTAHKLSDALGIYDADKGLAYRGTYLIDPKGLVRWIAVYELGVGRNVTEVLRVLDALQTDKFCPCNWQKGDETLN